MRKLNEISVFDKCKYSCHSTVLKLITDNYYYLL